MRLLLVDNDTDTLQELYDLCVRCGFEVTIQHCLAVSAATAEACDIVVLSGGYWYDDVEKHLVTYTGELELIRNATVPVIGICLGMQLMHVAYSGDVPLLDQPQSGLQAVDVTELGQMLLGLPPVMEVHKNHTRGVLSVGADFEVLATSPGHLEIIQHTTRPLLGMQFHPEVGDEATNTALFKTLLAHVGVPVPTTPLAPLRDTPAHSILDDTWYKQLTRIAGVATEIYTVLGPSPVELASAKRLFFASSAAVNPALRPSPAMDYTALERNRAQLEQLLTQVLQEISNPLVQSAYEQRITELIQNVDLLFASLAGDDTTFATLNTMLYGVPDVHIFAAAAGHFRTQAEAALNHSEPAVKAAAAMVLEVLPNVSQPPAMLQPDPQTFAAIKQLHEGPDGFYTKLFAGALLPVTKTITARAGDALLHRLLQNIGATSYRLIDATDGFWGVRYHPQGIVRPLSYRLPREQFLGTVGHEIGSHLLERLNGADQPLRLLGFGLQGYEAGNEGRAVLREQIVYPNWHTWASQLRWQDILRRHVAISLGIGLDRGRPRTFAEVYAIMHAVDVLWEHLHDNDSDAIQRAQDRTWDLLTRVLSGTNGTGGAYLKDIVYLEGNTACWQLAATRPDLIMAGDHGKFAITNSDHLALLRGLGITL